MAWAFTLSAECGIDKSAADAFAAYFKEYSAKDHREIAYSCYLRVYYDDGWWATVFPQGISTRGVTCEEDRLQMNAMASQFYLALKSAPEFRYALVGVEVDSFRSFSELDEDLVNRHYDGLVISEAIWKRIGSPNIFRAFRPGYYWREFVSVE